MQRVYLIDAGASTPCRTRFLAHQGTAAGFTDLEALLIDFLDPASPGGKSALEIEASRSPRPLQRRRP